MGLWGSFKQKYNDASESVGLGPRGFTPFMFTSRRLQMESTQLGGIIPNNPVSDLLNETVAWYEMWINPQKVDISRPFLHKKVNTAGAIVTFHYRPDVETMSVSGVCGWIAIMPQEEKNAKKSLGFKKPESAKKFYDIWDANKVKLTQPASNSPRIFLSRLRNLAEEPMYFIDMNGLEHYNTKYIKIFTKQYPKGALCEGYFTDFSVPESGDDAQTINYSFKFIIEKRTALSDLQEMAGMFSNTPSSSRKGVSMLPGL